MEIIHQLDSLFFALFPSIQPGDTKAIQQEMARYYSTPYFQPDVTIEGDIIKIHIKTDHLESLEKDYKKAITLCDTRRYDDAKVLLASLIEKNPTNSEFYRILGQIYSEQGDQESAINYLIESLKWNNKNTYALTMMGNILFLHKNEPDTALIYFNQVLKINPNDHLALNNIGSQLGKLGRMEEARLYLERAIASNPEFPNTYLGLGIIADNSDNTLEAFDYYLKGLKFNPKHDEIYKKILNNLLILCKQIIEKDFGNYLFDKYKSQLESRSGVSIVIESSESEPHYAKIEFAEIYNRNHHIVKYKPSKPGIAHLIMHELTHLKFSLDAKDSNNYQLIVSDDKK
jgi:tetratricopeptide (TPR) repeat protein